VRGCDAQRGAGVVDEGQAGGGRRGGTGARGALGAVEPASASPHDLGGPDAAAALAGGGRLSRDGRAPEVAVSPRPQAAAAGGHARAPSPDRRRGAHGSPRPGRLRGRGEGPGGWRGGAYALAPYVVSPPIAVRRIRRYDGQRGRYGYPEHKTTSRQEEEVAALTCLGWRGQPFVPQGLHRLR